MHVPCSYRCKEIFIFAKIKSVQNATEIRPFFLRSSAICLISFSIFRPTTFQSNYCYFRTVSLKLLDNHIGFSNVFCGKYLPPNWKSLSNRVSIDFISDGSLIGNGFELHYNLSSIANLPSIPSNNTFPKIPYSPKFFSIFGTAIALN